MFALAFESARFDSSHAQWAVKLIWHFFLILQHPTLASCCGHDYSRLSHRNRHKANDFSVCGGGSVVVSPVSGWPLYDSATSRPFPLENLLIKMWFRFQFFLIIHACVCAPCQVLFSDLTVITVIVLPLPWCCHPNHNCLDFDVFCWLLLETTRFFQSLRNQIRTRLSGYFFVVPKNWRKRAAIISLISWLSWSTLNFRIAPSFLEQPIWVDLGCKLEMTVLGFNLPSVDNNWM